MKGARGDAGQWVQRAAGHGADGRAGPCDGYISLLK